MKKPQRKPIPLMQSTQLRSQSQSTDSFAPMQDVEVQPSSASQMLQTLNDVFPDIAAGATNEINRVVQEDKIVQENRALAGEEPTADATKAGTTAHAAVGWRNAAAESSRALAQKAAVFEGSDEEWDRVVAAEQDALLAQVGDDENMLNAVGEIFRKTLPKVADTRFTAKQQQDQTAKFRTTMDSYRAAVLDAGEDPELLKSNIVQIQGESAFMGLAPEMQRKALIQSAVLGAEEGSLDLLNFIKEETNWYSQEAGLVRAEKDAMSYLARQQAGDVAIMKTDLKTEAMYSPNMTFEQFAAKAQSQGTAEGLPVWTEAQIRSEWGAIQQQQDAAFAAETVYFQSLARMSDETAPPISYQNLSKKDLQSVVNLFDQNQSQELVQFQGQSPTPEDTKTFVAQQRNFKAKWLQENNIVDSKLSSQLNTLETFDGMSLEGTELDKETRSVLGIFDDLSDSRGAISNHASNKSIVISDNYQRNRQAGMNEVQAYQLAWKQANNPPVQMDRKQKSAFGKDVKDVVEGELKHGMFSRYILGAPDSVGSRQQETIQEQVSARATDLIRGGANPESAVGIAMKEYTDTHTQLSTGAVVYGTRTQIANKMGVSIDKIDGIIAALPAQIDEEGLSNTDTPPEDWIPVVTPNGLIAFVDEWGARVSQPITLSEAAGVSLSQKAAALAKEQDQIRADRLERQANINNSQASLSQYRGDYLTTTRERSKGKPYSYNQ